MNLIGAEIERRGLQGDEGLAAIVDAFTAESSALVEGGFNPVNRTLAAEYAKSVARNRLEIQNAVASLRREVPLPSQTEGIQEAIESLVGRYICADLGRTYDLLSPELFNLKRRIDVTVKASRPYESDKTHEVDIPAFANSTLNESEWAYSAEISSDGRTPNLFISSKMPPITLEAKERAREARALYLGACARGLRTEHLGDILQRDLESGRAGLDLRVYWIPKPSELKIEVQQVDKDPFLVAGVYGRHYLVARWDVAGEKPFEHYLAEFTEKKAGK